MLEKRKVEIKDRIAEIRSLAEAGEGSPEELRAELEQLGEEKRSIEEKLSVMTKADEAELRTIEKIEKVEDKKTMEMTFEQRMNDPASVEYRDIWLKRMKGEVLNEVEQRSVAATNVSGAIPTMTSERIFNKIREIAPLLGEVTLLNVAGNVNFAVEGTNNDAALHTENAELTAQSDTLVTVSLAGYEIAKLVRISATVQTMTINAFEGWLADLLAENIATVIENYMINGTGSSQPKGVEKAQVWSDTNNAVDWNAASPTYAELTETISYLKGGYYRRAKWLMNHKTFWNRVQAIRDDAKAPIVKEMGGKYYILGKEVLFSDYVLDDVIYIGDFRKMVANLAQQVNVAKSEHSGFAYNAVDFRGTAIFDCDIAVGEAFVKSAATL